MHLSSSCQSINLRHFRTDGGPRSCPGRRDNEFENKIWEHQNTRNHESIAIPSKYRWGTLLSSITNIPHALRFRLRSDIRDFEQGNDLCGPSGDIWYISSRCLYLGNQYKSMHQRLINDDLLESRPHPAIPDSVLRHLVIPLTSFGQSFVVDLTTRNLAPSFITSLSPPTVLELGLLDVFRETSIKNRKNPLFSGKQIDPWLGHPVC